MGEIFFKRLFVLFLLVVSLFFVLEIIKNNNIVNVAPEVAITGRVTHPLYSGFSSPEQGFIFNNNSNVISVTDTAVYKMGYYSVNGGAWQSFALSGNSYNGDANWLSGSSSKTLPSFGTGEHYVIIYSCTYSWGSWDCHEGKWQLLIINVPGSSCGNVVCGSGEYCFQGVCLLNVSGKTYFVATNGNDNNSGNFTNPWATFQKAVNNMSAGDITYFRGGVYNQTKSIKMAYAYNGKSGTEANPIRYFNYPGETPIFDGTGREIGTTTFYCLVLQEKSYIHFKGLKFVNFAQNAAEVGEVHCVYDQDSHDITYENIVLQNIGGVGFHTHDSYAINYINCDASDCSDPLSPYDVNGGSGPGNNGAGFRFTSHKIFGGSYEPVSYYGCRAWNISDDGFQGQYAGLVTFDHCWSWANGYLPMGGGAGFKLGWFDYDVEPLTRSVTHCIAANNAVRGFHENNDNSGRPNMFIYNNFAYNNSYGFVSWSYSLYPENQNIYRNNLGYANRELDGYASLGYVHDHNSWDLPYSNYNPYRNPPSVNDDDFVSLDSSQLALPRKADGSLPDITFGHLKEGSDLIDRGIDVGLPYAGSAPDLGAFETTYSKESFCGGGSCVNRCGAFYTPGETYVLTSDVSSEGTCFTVAAANVTLDCNNHRITYSTGGSSGTYGIYMNQFNTTIKNCNIMDGNWASSAADRFGIYFYYSTNSNLINNNVSTNLQRTIYLWQSSNNTLINNTAASNTNVGLMVLISSNNTLIDNKGISNTNDGLVIHTSSGNLLANNTGFSNTGSGLSLMSSSGTFISGQSATGVYGISIRSSSSNVFKDCGAIHGGTQNIYTSTDSLNNTFTNCS